MDTLIQLIQKLDLHTIIVIVACFYFYDKRMSKKLEKIDARFDKIEARFEKVDARFDKMFELLMDMDKRICRIEGALSAQECCILKEPKAKKTKNIG